MKKGLLGAKSLNCITMCLQICVRCSTVVFSEYDVLFLFFRVYTAYALSMVRKTSQMAWPRVHNPWEQTQ